MEQTNDWDKIAEDKNHPVAKRYGPEQIGWGQKR